MSRQRRRHIEELRDALSILKTDAAMLYQYQGLGHTSNFFKELSETDRRRLVAIGLSSGDRDVATVARYLMTLLSPVPRDEQDLVDHLPEEDKREAKMVFQVGLQRPMTGDFAAYIALEVKKAVESMGSVKLETAVWTLIQADNGFDSVWIDASCRSGTSPTAAGLKLSTKVLYEPDPAERAQLFGMMRKAAWVFHFHNHPQEIPRPSETDREFVRYWKALRPELACKMKFFIISGNHAVEYDERDKCGP